MDPAAFFEAMPEWAGTLPQLVSAVSTSSIAVMLFLLIKWWVAKGDLGIRAQQVKLEGEKVELEGEEHLRTHFREELDRMAGQLKDQDERLNAAAERQRACEEREERLRRRVRKAEDEITGLKRIIVVNSATGAIDLTEGGSNEEVRLLAIKVLEDIAKGRDGHPPEENGSK